MRLGAVCRGRGQPEGNRITSDRVRGSSEQGRLAPTIVMLKASSHCPMNRLTVAEPNSSRINGSLNCTQMCVRMCQGSCVSVRVSQECVRVYFRLCQGGCMCRTWSKNLRQIGSGSAVSNSLRPNRASLAEASRSLSPAVIARQQHGGGVERECGKVSDGRL